MKPAFNRFRLVREMGAAIEEWQCLVCGRFWQARTRPGEWCSYCGTRWEGEHLWMDEEARRRVETKALAASRKPVPADEWLVEYRLLERSDDENGWTDSGGLGWTEKTTFPARWNAVRVHRELGRLRESWPDDQFARTEFRAKLRQAPVSFGPPPEL